MKETEVKEDFKSLTVEELRQKLETLRGEKLNIVMNAATAHIKDYSQVKKLRKNIARVLTLLHQKEKGI